MVFSCKQVNIGKRVDNDVILDLNGFDSRISKEKLELFIYNHYGNDVSK